MRNTGFIVAAFAALTAAFAACTSTELDVVVPDGTLTKKTFEAIMGDAPGSKTTLNANGKTIEWKAGDFIAVYDDVDPTTPHKFTALSNGTTSSFEGEVNTGSTKFYAVYPYDACVTFDSANERFTVQIPQVQYAVKDGYDPRANVAAAYVEGTVDDKLYFKLVNGLLKFTVDYDNIVGVQIENTSRCMSGYYTFDVLSAESAKIANVGDSNLEAGYKSSRYKNIMLKNEDGSPLEQGATYYIVSRQSSADNPYVSPSVSLISSSAQVAVKSSANGLVVARKSVVNLGEFASLSFETSRYAAYQAGFDVEVAGNVYNISTNGSASLLNASGDDFDIRSTMIGASGVFFLKSDGHNFINGTPSNSYNSSGDIVLIADSDNVTYRIEKAMNITQGSLVMKGIDIDATGFTSNIFSNGSYVSDPTALIFEDCTFKGLEKQIFNTNSSQYNHGINKVIFNGCQIEFAAAVGGVININKNATSVSAWKEFVFTNNIVYSSTGSNLLSKILNCAAKYTAAGDSVLKLRIENSIFYNIANNGSLFTFPSYSKITVDKVLQFVVDDTNVGGDSGISKLFKSDSAQHSDSSASNFGVYGTLTGGDTNTFVLCDSGDRIGGITNTVTTLADYPFVSATPLTGGFALIPAYASTYGPQ